MIGERYIRVALYETGEWFGDNETWCTGFNNDNFRRTGRISGTEIIELAPIPGITPDTSATAPNSGGRFGSAHSGNWQVVFCDGSVSFISYDIDWQIHRDLGNRKDGNVTDVSNPFQSMNRIMPIWSPLLRVELNSPRGHASQVAAPG